MELAFFGALMGILVVLSFRVVAEMRDAGRFVTRKPRRLRTVRTTASREEALRIILEHAALRGYEIEVVSRDASCVVLSGSMTAVSWGFYYPVYLSLQADGYTVVEVGIRSRAAQVGPIVSRYHGRFVNGLWGAFRAGGHTMEP